MMVALALLSSIIVHSQDLEEKLIQAVENQDIDVTRSLLDRGANLETKDHKNNFLFHLAARKGFEEIVELFIQKGVDINLKNKYGETILHYSIGFGHKELTKYLISKGAVIQSESLGQVAYQGWVDIADYIISAGVGVDEKKYDETPLFNAVRNRKVEMANFLINKGANVNALSQKGESPLSEAVYYGHSELFDLLISNGAKIDVIDKSFGESLLHKAASEGHVDIVDKLIKRGLSVDLRSKDWGQTSLHLAAQNGHVDVARLLIENGANVKAIDREKRSVTFWAITKGDEIELIDILINNGVDPNHEDLFGNKPLFAAIAYNKVKIAKKLVSIETLNLDSKNKKGYTYLSYAVERNRKEIIELLLEKGADVNETFYGLTPLAIAKKNNYLEIQNLLLEYGAKQ